MLPYVGGLLLTLVGTFLLGSCHSAHIFYVAVDAPGVVSVAIPNGGGGWYELERLDPLERIDPNRQEFAHRGPSAYPPRQVRLTVDGQVHLLDREAGAGTPRYNSPSSIRATGTMHEFRIMETPEGEFVFDHSRYSQAVYTRIGYLLVIDGEPPRH